MGNVKVHGNSGHAFRQGRLWDAPVDDPTPAVKAAMREVIKGCPLSREEITEDMNRLAILAGIRRKATPALLDKWVAPSSDHEISLRMLRLFCRATGNNLPLEVYAKGFKGVRGLLDEETVDDLEWARKQIAFRRAKKEADQADRKKGLR